MDVPELAARGDRDAADRWRESRRTARASFGSSAVGRLAVALATDGRHAATGRAITDAGADLVGLLAPEPLESLAWAAATGARHAYPDLRSLLSDEVEALCVDLDLPLGGAVARAAVGAGVHMLLARYAGEGLDQLRELFDDAGGNDVLVTVALTVRCWPSVPAVLELVPALGALRQVTVVGWPIGREARLELVDLVRRLCGDVVAVCAARGTMPATDLRPGEPVTLALLTESGATVLAAERPSARPADATVTMVGTDGRLVFGSDFVRRQDARGVAASSLPEGAAMASPIGVALAGLEWDPAPSEGPREPIAATLGDLLAGARVLDVAATSFDVGNWLET